MRKILFIFILISLCMLGCSLDGELNGVIAPEDKPAVSTLNCPQNYILVPADNIYTTQDFCIMKYEAKQEYDGAIVPNGTGGHDYNTDYSTPAELARYMAVSVPEGRPWTALYRGGITNYGALEACQQIGAGYELPTNDQWQTTAQNIEQQASNWVLDSYGDTSLSHGHADNDPAQTCDSLVAAVDNDCSNTAGAPETEEDRRHILSNNEILWDFAGNADEWVKDDSTFDYGYFGVVYAVTNVTGNAGPLGTVKYAFGPKNTYGVNLNNRHGLGNLWLNYTSGTIYRGGRLNSSTGSGVFYAGLNAGYGAAHGHIGFRCVYNAQ